MRDLRLPGRARMRRGPGSLGAAGGERGYVHAAFPCLVDEVGGADVRGRGVAGDLGVVAVERAAAVRLDLCERAAVDGLGAGCDSGHVGLCAGETVDGVAKAVDGVAEGAEPGGEVGDLAGQAADVGLLLPLERGDVTLF